MSRAASAIDPAGIASPDYRHDPQKIKRLSAKPRTGFFPIVAFASAERRSNDINFVKSICYRRPVWPPKCSGFLGQFQDFGILRAEMAEAVAAHYFFFDILGF